MKPSEIWDQADKELTQCFHSYGKAQDKTACAEGALVYYISQGRTCVPSGLKNEEASDFRILLSQIMAVTPFHEFGMAIYMLNDAKRLTFKQFAEMARSAGL